MNLVRGTAARRHLPVLFIGAAALTSAAVVWFALPHDRDVRSVWILLAKLVPFLLAAEAIARLDPALLRMEWLHKVAIPAVFLVFFCWFVPKIFFYSDDFNQLYYMMLTLTPVVILGLVLAFRLGGGAPWPARRLAVGLLLLMLSGLEDLAFLVVNHSDFPPTSRYAHIPDVWTWASHMTVFLGHPPTKYEAFTFIGIHVLLALLVLFVPARFVRAALRRAGSVARLERHSDVPS